jgi:hypothetical protein
MLPGEQSADLGQKLLNAQRLVSKRQQGKQGRPYPDPGDRAGFAAHVRAVQARAWALRSIDRRIYQA